MTDRLKRRVPAVSVSAASALAHQQTSCTPLLLSIDGTDGRTPGRYIDPAPHTMQAASINRCINVSEQSHRHVLSRANKVK